MLWALGRRNTEEWADLPTGCRISGSWYHWLRLVTIWWYPEYSDRESVFSQRSPNVGLWCEWSWPHHFCWNPRKWVIRSWGIFTSEDGDGIRQIEIIQESLFCVGALGAVVYTAATVTDDTSLGRRLGLGLASSHTHTLGHPGWQKMSRGLYRYYNYTNVYCPWCREQRHLPHDHIVACGRRCNHWYG